LVLLSFIHFIELETNSICNIFIVAITMSYHILQKLNTNLHHFNNFSNKGVKIGIWMGRVRLCNPFSLKTSAPLPIPFRAIASCTHTITYCSPSIFPDSTL